MQSINRILIVNFQVPDRGGRTNEIAPPPPEMPSWQQRIPGPQNMGRGGRGRGNYNQGNGRGSYTQGGGQQAYSKGDTQFNTERGNNSIKNPADRSNKPYSGFKSSSSDSKPFSNFNTSLSMYSSYSPSFSRLGNTNTKPDYAGSRDYARSNKDSESNVREGLSQNFDSAGSYDNPNKRPRTSYKSSDTDLKSNNCSQKRSFNIAGSNEERGNYNSRTNYGNYGGDNQSNYTAYDSAGSYDTNKRVKSYDNFRNDNASYSDQYVRDTQHNQQNHSRNESSRGRSNYHRGRGNRYNR